MWFMVISGWLLGTAALYVYLISTAKEPERDECFDCSLTECTECPYKAKSRNRQLKRAA
jgi:hypothetical protein